VILTSDPLTLNRYIRCHVIKVCTQFEHNRIIPDWVIDNWVTFCPVITSRCDLALWPLIMDVCSRSDVTWSNSVPNLSKMKHFSVKLLTIFKGGGANFQILLLRRVYQTAPNSERTEFHHPCTERETLPPIGCFVSK